MLIAVKVPAVMLLARDVGVGQTNRDKSGAIANHSTAVDALECASERLQLFFVGNPNVENVFLFVLVEEDSRIELG
jgi:hypothetical protein